MLMKIEEGAKTSAATDVDNDVKEPVNQNQEHV